MMCLQLTKRAWKKAKQVKRMGKGIIILIKEKKLMIYQRKRGKREKK